MTPTEYLIQSARELGGRINWALAARHTLEFAGLVLFTVAAFTWSLVLGWAVAGASCWAMSWALAPDDR